MSIRQLHEVIALERPMIGLDLETTGVDPRSSSIVELALEIMIPGKPVKEYRTLVNPLMPIPKAASVIHGITHDMVRDAPTFKQLAANLLSGLQEVDFAGYNVWFDLRQLAEEFKRAGHEWSYEGARVIDGFRLWQLAEGRTLTHAYHRWLRNRDGLYNEQVAAELEIDGQAHNALWDTKVATRVIAAQLQACSQFPRDVQRLHELQWPDRFDADGKLRWNKDGDLCFTFGEHRDKPLRSVPSGYFRWIIGKDFSPKVKETCANALKGIYPTAPLALPSDEDDAV